MRVQKHAERTEYDLQCSIWQPALAAFTRDCKTVGFFLKISKDIGKTWGKSLTRAKRAILTRERKTPSVPGLTLRFQPRSRPFVWLLEQTLRTVLQSTFTLQTGFLSETGRKMIRINKLQGSLQASLINNTGWMLQRIKFYPKVVRVTKDYKILKTKEYGMTQCY